MIINDEPLTDPQDVQKHRTGVGTLLYVSSDCPDVQYYVKELAGKLQTPTKSAMASLTQLIGYISATKDIHIKMEGRNPSANFRKKAEGLSSSPDYEYAGDIWLVEVATDSDWSGQKETRSSTSCG